MQHILTAPLKQVWLRAAVAGSIWASFEIILGSFLHNLKVPLSGTILSFIGVWTVIAFQQFWNDRGLIWRAGLICALMKSISPSAIILGPMIGIFSEALVIEFFVRIFGRNLFAFIIGGGLAVLTTLVQKIVNLLILYGFDLVRIFDGLYKFSVKQIGMENLNPWYLLTIIASVYIVAGAIGATGGYITGRKFSGKRVTETGSGSISFSTDNRLFSRTTDEKYSILFLLINILVIAAILLLLNSNMLIYAGPAAALYIAFCITYYKGSLRRLKKPGFWITFLLITFGAAFIWKWFSDGVFFTSEGLLAGLKMNARAVVMVIGFATISVELKNPVIKSVLYNRGFASLYQSLSLSFSALPYIISTISSKESSGRKTFHNIFSQADDLYNAFKNEHLKRPSIVIITGEVHEGKTTFAGQVINNLEKQGIKAGGFLAIAVNKDGKRSGFNLFDIRTGNITPLCSQDSSAGKMRYGSFYFNEEAVNRGINIVHESASDCNLVIIDEIGPLELGGSGWSSAIDFLFSRNFSPQVWVVRKPLIKKVLRRWNAGETWIFDISTDSPGDTAEKIKELVIASSQPCRY